MPKSPRNGRGRTRLVAAGGRPLRILLVENHPDTRRGMKAFLDVLGHQADCAEDKASALALAAKEKFDLLLSDISLPDGDGWELLQALSASCRRPPHAIAMSGLGDLANLARSEAAGYEMHLTKPFRPEELELTLQHLASAPQREKLEMAGPTVGVRPACGLKQALHDGICQHLAAAALLQNSLTHALKTLEQAPTMMLVGQVSRFVKESEQISRLIDDALAEAVVLMQAAD